MSQTFILSRDMVPDIAAFVIPSGTGQMAIGIGRREFVSALGGAVAIWPFAARAQQPAMPVIGFLGTQSADVSGARVSAFRQGLSESGYVEGKNVAIDYLWAEGQYDRLPGLVAELVRRRVAVIVSAGGSQGAVAAKAATSTIPIVFSAGADPIQSNLVSSLNRPGGNATGVSILIGGLDPKKIGLLHELVPLASLIAVLLDPHTSDFQVRLEALQGAARAAALNIHTVQATTEQEIDAAFATFAQLRAGALVVSPSPFFDTRRDQLVALAARYSLPAIYDESEFAVAGGLMSYGTDFVESYRQVGIYTGRVLKGEKPSDMPVMQSTKFDFVINLKTAKALGLSVPSGLLSIADEVIE
jgi:putative ABC transport system substrate-binding protein